MHIQHQNTITTTKLIIQIIKCCYTEEMTVIFNCEVDGVLDIGVLICSISRLS